MRLSWSAAAKRDLRRIAEYSIERWGEEIAERYVVALVDRTKEIAANPERERVFRKGYRKSTCGSHYVIYTMNPGRGRVVIVRILHQSMDLGRHLPNPGGA